MRRAPRNEHMLSPPLYRSPQSSIKVYLKTLPAASTSMSTWPLAPTSAPVLPVTFFCSSFLFFRGPTREKGEERRKKEKRSESRERGRVVVGFSRSTARVSSVSKKNSSSQARAKLACRLRGGDSRSLSLPLCSLSALSFLSPSFLSYSPQARAASSSRCRRPSGMSQRQTSRGRPRTPEPFQRPPRWSRRRCRRAARP